VGGGEIQKTQRRGFRKSTCLMSGVVSRDGKLNRGGPRSRRRSRTEERRGLGRGRGRDSEGKGKIRVGGFDKRGRTELLHMEVREPLMAAETQSGKPDKGIEKKERCSKGGNVKRGRLRGERGPLRKASDSWAIGGRKKELGGLIWRRKGIIY